MPSPFDHAPDPVVVDGLLAVPIDIHTLTAQLAFDAVAHSCEVDATIDFTVGPTGGNPIFDLRQTPLEAWLDGALLPVAKLAHHDFGGGSDARLRVVESSLAAGSSHSLRLKYQLGLPDAQSSGSGPPTYSWTGDRLTLKFWYTDLRPGRYLDAWLPGNLLYDQFGAILDILITGTTEPHVIVTNGTVTPVAANRWSVAFPAYFSVCSSMLRIHPAADIASRKETVALSTGTSMEIETHKPAGSSTNLAEATTTIATLLGSFEASTGPYAHGNRFLCFFEGPSGMEYAGACRTDMALLSHEVFHSWMGRGVQPATQQDSWFDEAWTTYVTGGFGPSPFNFSDPPIELYPENQWTRRTLSASYIAGRAVFQGVAAAIGDASLRALMADFYWRHRTRPATTLQLEGSLLAGSGNTDIVDAFHRFVYGFADPGDTPNVWMKDHTDHTGSETWTERFWDSPDLWIRPNDDHATTHENPVEGQDNWIFARVRNMGATARHFMVVFNAPPWAGTQFVYPNDYLPGIAATGGFELRPGEEQVVKAMWPVDKVPPAGTHSCLLAAIIARGDHPTTGAHVWEDNNLAQKNLTVVELDADGWVVIPVLVGHPSMLAQSITLRVVRPKTSPDLRVTVLLPRASRETGRDFADCGGPGDTAPPFTGMWTNHAKEASTAVRFRNAKELELRPGSTVDFPFQSRGGYPALIGLRVKAPARWRKSALTVDLVELDEKGKRVAGGVAIELRSKRRSNDRR